MPDLEEDGRDDVFDDAVVEDAPLLTVDAVVNAARLKANATAKEYNTCTREIPLRGTRRKLVDDMYGIIASTVSGNPKVRAAYYQMLAYASTFVRTNGTVMDIDVA